MPSATQEINTYSSVAAAQAAYQAIEKDAANCSKADFENVDGVASTEVATTTASITDGFAYTDVLRTDQGRPAQVNGNYSAASDYHVYVVLSGNRVEVVYLAGGPAVDDARRDAAALGVLAAALR